MYMNALIGLEENMPTYGIDGKKVSGHVTISTPGIIKCYVQSLKEGRRYALYAFSSKDEKGLRIGTLMPPSESRETKWRIDENNVLGSSIKAKDIDAVAVVKEGSSMRSTDTILLGFTRNKYRISSFLEQLLPEEEQMAQTGSPMAPTGNNSMTQAGNKMFQTGAGMLPTGTTIIPAESGMAQEETMMTPTGTGMAQEETTMTPTGTNMMQEETTMTSTGVCNTQAINDMFQAMLQNMLNGQMMQTPTGTEMPEGHMEEPKEMEMPEEFEVFEDIQEIEGIEIPEGLEMPVEMEEIDDDDSEGCSCTVERVLNNSYTKQQDFRAAFEQLNKQAMADERAQKRNDQTREGEMQQETPEEISYLEEIEKKLKDIQTRLKASETLEQDIKKFQHTQFADERQNDTQKKSIMNEIPIEDILNKLAELKSSMDASGSSSELQSAGSDIKLERLYHGAPAVLPFECPKDDMDWVSITLSDLSMIDTLPRQWCTQPFVTFSYYKYNEIILGKSRSSGRYCIGIPDIYHPERRNILEADMKVEKFVCRKNMQPAIGEYGYWLINL